MSRRRIHRKLTPAEAQNMRMMRRHVGGGQIPIGCDGCDAHQTVEWIGMAGGGWMLCTHHEDSCSVVAKLEARGGHAA